MKPTLRRGLLQAAIATLFVAGVVNAGSGRWPNSGAMSPATPSSAGSLSAADKSLLDMIRSDWYVTQALTMQAANAALVKCRPLPKPQASWASTTAVNFTTTDGASLGGGVKANNGASNTYFYQSVTTTPKTAGWGIAFRARLLGGAVAGHDSTVGLANSGGTHAWSFRHANSYGANYGLTLYGTSTLTNAGTATADNNEHDFAFVYISSTTTIKVYVDGVLDVTTSTVTNMADEAMYPYAYSATVLEVEVKDMEVCTS